MHNNKPTRTLYSCNFTHKRVWGYTSEGDFVSEPILSRNEDLLLFETERCVWSGTRKEWPQEDFALELHHEPYMDDHERDFYSEHAQEVRELDWRGRL